MYIPTQVLSIRLDMMKLTIPSSSSGRIYTILLIFHLKTNASDEDYLEMQNDSYQLTIQLISGAR